MAALDPEDLDVWKLSMKLVTALYRETAQWPDTERFGLISQVRRAAVSVPTNIAEGHGRGTTRDYLRFLDIADGSLAEVRTLLQIACNIEFATAESTQKYLTEARQVGRLLGGLKKALRKKLTGPEQQDPEQQGPEQQGPTQ